MTPTIVRCQTHGCPVSARLEAVSISLADVLDYGWHCPSCHGKRKRNKGRR